MLKYDLSSSEIVHAGRLYRCKSGINKGNPRWKEAWAVLMKDGTFLWYNDKRCSYLHGKVAFRDIYKQIQIGRGAQDFFGPKCPKPSKLARPGCLIAIPVPKQAKRFNVGKKSGKDSDDLKPGPAVSHYQWLCTKSQRDLGQWIAVFAGAIDKEGQYEKLRKEMLQGFKDPSKPQMRRASILEHPADLGSAGEDDEDNGDCGSDSEKLHARNEHSEKWHLVWDELRGGQEPRPKPRLSIRPSIVPGSEEYEALMQRFLSADSVGFAATFDNEVDLSDEESGSDVASRSDSDAGERLYRATPVMVSDTSVVEAGLANRNGYLYHGDNVADERRPGIGEPLDIIREGDNSESSSMAPEQPDIFISSTSSTFNDANDSGRDTQENSPGSR